MIMFHVNLPGCISKRNGALRIRFSPQRVAIYFEDRTENPPPAKNSPLQGPMILVVWRCDFQGMHVISSENFHLDVALEVI